MRASRRCVDVGRHGRRFARNVAPDGSATRRRRRAYPRRDGRHTRFDPTAPLAGRARPVGVDARRRSSRDGPPYHMTDMIAAEPALAARILERLDDPQGPAAAAGRRDRPGGERRRADRRHRLRDHRARGAWAWSRSCARRSGRRAAGGPSVDPRGAGVRARPGPAGDAASSSAISHEGGTTATNRALAAAPRGRRADRAHHRQRRSPGAAARRHRRRDRRAGPELVPHGRLPVPDRSPRRRSRAS